MEIRLIDQAFELWVDYALVGQATIDDYVPADIGFGVNVNKDAEAPTFSAAVDDMTVYPLAP
ncbi:MAG: hypothetical protein ACJ789_14175 [Thermomicrobiales bacterium]